MSPRDAIYEACLERFRPILMTTLAALFGAMPIAFGEGVGAELRRPLGVTIMGGLILEPGADALHDADHLSRHGAAVAAAVAVRGAQAAGLAMPAPGE